MKNKVTIIIWVVAIIAVMSAAYTYYSKNKSQAFVPPPQQTTEQSAPSGQLPDNSKVKAPDFTLKDLEGNTVKLSDYKGKIVILNFWAVWCKYCRLEMPEFNEFNKELSKKNEAVILTVDVQESKETVKNFITSNNIDLKVLMDEEGTVATAYGITGYPTTFIINRDGTIYTAISGATDKVTLQNVLDNINKGTTSN